MRKKKVLFEVKISLRSILGVASVNMTALAYILIAYIDMKRSAHKTSIALSLESGFRCFVSIWITIFVTFFIGIQAKAETKSVCSQLFMDTYNRAYGSMDRQAVIRDRALAIIQHQNKLRAEAGLPLFESKDYEKNLNKKAPAKITSDKRYVVVNSKLVFIGMDETMVFTALKTDDVHSLNYVYKFEGTKLIDAIPAATYYISRMSETIEIRRGLSSQEAQLWKSGNLAALRSHSKAIGWGYSEPVAHFSVIQFHSDNRPTISASIPREILLQWAQQKLITIGSEGDLNGKPYGIEIAIKAGAWSELLKYLD